MRNNIQRSIYSHIFANIKGIVTKKGYGNMNPFKGEATGQKGQATKRNEPSPKEAPKEKSSWWSGFTKSSDKKDSADKESDSKEGDFASPFYQNFVHIVSMCEEFLINDMRKEAQEEEEEEALLADEDEEPDEELLKKKRKHKKDQLLADFGLMEQALYIFDCLFWDQAVLAQVLALCFLLLHYAWGCDSFCPAVACCCSPCRQPSSTCSTSRQGASCRSLFRSRC
jgi:hypothetical protein